MELALADRFPAPGPASSFWKRGCSRKAIPNPDGAVARREWGRPGTVTKRLRAPCSWRDPFPQRVSHRAAQLPFPIDSTRGIAGAQQLQSVFAFA